MIERRIGLLFCGFLILFSMTATRAVWLQAVEGGQLSAEARGQQTEKVVVPGHRGAIFDRHGKQLAVSEDAAAIFATPYQVTDPVGAAKRLAPLLRVPAERLLAKLANRRSGFAYLRRKAPVSLAERVRGLAIAGIGFLPDTRRVYPQGYFASQVLGTVGIDNDGLSGLENAHQGTLRGIDGEQKVVKDALGEAIDFETIRRGGTGRSLTLTLDSAVQARTERVLAEVGATYRPRGATAIVVDPRSGEVLAMANWPRVDANDIGGAPPEALANRATGTNYEPGSTFKAFTVAGALEEDLVGPESTFSFGPTVQVADREIGEAHEGGGGTMAVSQILARSSNVGSVLVGLRLGKRRFDRWVRRFGFGRPTGIDFPGEERGIVPRVEEYSGSTMGNAPIGQGLSVTPVQMAAAYAAIANGGVWRTPRLVRSVAGVRVRRPPGVRAISPRTARQLRRMLAGVLAPGGTAQEVSVPGYELAGKTGTAQKAEGGGYSKTRFVASFIGFAPAERPRLLVAVMVDEPKGSYYGAAVAAPAFGKIAAFALPYLGISPN